MRDPSEFKPGIYRHYKGDKYVALHIARHHETNEPLVVYFCPKHGTISVREWDSEGKDSWCDEVISPAQQGESVWCPRFEYLRPAL